jgi:FixJ family two-component response regulator
MVPKTRIAIVDDEEPVRRALARMLSASLFSVECFATGQEFLDSLLTRTPDWVLLDYHMPGLSGGDVQRRLALANIPVPVIVMTAHDEPAVREQSYGEGAFAYLSKPLRRDRLLGIIAAASGAEI